MEKVSDVPMEMGVQPLDRILNELGLKNCDLVEHSTEQLTHKMVAKGRKGRRLTLNAQLKILNALNGCHKDKRHSLEDLFTYKGKR